MTVCLSIELIKNNNNASLFLSAHKQYNSFTSCYMQDPRKGLDLAGQDLALSCSFTTYLLFLAKIILKCKIWDSCGLEMSEYFLED